MNAEVKKKWVAALKSREYTQAQKRLREPDTSSYCCLGVLCDLYLKETGEGKWGLDGYFEVNGVSDRGVPPPAVWEWAGLPDSNPNVDLSSYDLDLTTGYTESLANGNDAGLTFAQIADVIEAQL